jgi:glycerate-2-kinase
MTIPQLIQDLASKVRTAVYGREVRESIAKSMEYTGSTANQASVKVESIQSQVNQLVVEGDSSVETAQARVDSKGISYNTLKDRLDTEQIVVSVTEPGTAEFWYEDKGSAD